MPTPSSTCDICGRVHGPEGRDLYKAIRDREPGAEVEGWFWFLGPGRGFAKIPGTV